MTTLEMEIAMMQELNPRQNLIVPNISWGAGLHECDLLMLTKSNYATEIEIKISKADLLKDKFKDHGHVSDKINRLFFAVPKKLEELALTEIPERAGLYVVYKNEYGQYYATCVKGCKIDRTAKKWTDEERYNIARLGTMRILNLKKKILKK